MSHKVKKRKMKTVAYNSLDDTYLIGRHTDIDPPTSIINIYNDLHKVRENLVSGDENAVRVGNELVAVTASLIM